MRDPQSSAPRVTVVGAGLAGCEAAWQAAGRGVEVVLYEMKPAHYSPAHRSPGFAELVCSNSLRSNLSRQRRGSLEGGDAAARIAGPGRRRRDSGAGGAGAGRGSHRVLAADHPERSRRIRGSRSVHQLVARIPEGETWVVVATGPLTAPELAAELQELVGEASLYFYDAISPSSTPTRSITRWRFAPLATRKARGTI